MSEKLEKPTDEVSQAVAIVGTAGLLSVAVTSMADSPEVLAAAVAWFREDIREHMSDDSDRVFAEDVAFAMQRFLDRVIEKAAKENTP